MDSKQKARGEEVRKEIAEQFYGGCCDFEHLNGYEWQSALSNADRFLNLKDSKGNYLVEVADPDQTELRNPYHILYAGNDNRVALAQNSKHDGYREALDDIAGANWKKCIPKEE